ncbi:MAG: hypothetical protein ACM3PY_06445 [Omnitrophica WOR_2 bacterium]
MATQTAALIVTGAWAILLVLYVVNRFGLKDRLAGGSPVIQISSEPYPDKKPGTFFSRLGVLFVFIVNILSLALVIGAALSPALEDWLSAWKVHFPLWLNWLGGILFVLYSIWGFLVLVYNPGYTPLTNNMQRKFILAVNGPYRLVRHPRYAAECFLNLALFLFTGIGLPLLGILGWPAVYNQARLEEASLLEITRDLYAGYRQKTGMFLPRLPGKK